MNEQNKKQIIFAAVLGVILVGVLVKQFVLAPGSPKASATATVASKTAPAGKAAPAKAAVPGGALQQVDIDIEALIKSVEVEPINYGTVRVDRNPMDPLVGGIPEVDSGVPNGQGVTMVDGEPVPGPTVDPNAPLEPTAPTPLTDAYSKRVTGIVWDVSYPVAVVDDEVVSVGHVFPNGTQVYSIEPSRVILKVGDSTIPIEMKDM